MIQARKPLLIMVFLFLNFSCSSLPTAPARKVGKKGLLDEPRPTDQTQLSGKKRIAKPDTGVQAEKLLATLSFIWPLKQVQITSPFGKRGKDFHEGIDLMAKNGTTVYSAHSGTVLYSGSRIKGYGKMIILRHPFGASTVYAHNSTLLVKKGQKVQKGRPIAISGKSGRATGPHLHFEVRNGIQAIDPLRVLPMSAKMISHDNKTEGLEKVSLAKTPNPVVID